MSAAEGLCPVGEVKWAANLPDTIIEVRWANGIAPPIGTKLYQRPQPPGAPAGVEAIRQARAIIDHVIHGEPGHELSAAHDLLTAALAQQPAAVGVGETVNPADTDGGIDGDWYCERHPWALQGHDGCDGAGLPACARIGMLCHIIRMRDQELRERDQQYGFLADRALAQQPKPAPVGVEAFVVRHYSEEEGPTIKGNGFDGLRVGEDREEAEQFVQWINEALSQQVTLELRNAAAEVYRISERDHVAWKRLKACLNRLDPAQVTMSERLTAYPERIVLWSRGVSPHWYFTARKSDRHNIEGTPVYETLDEIVLRGSPESQLPLNKGSIEQAVRAFWSGFNARPDGSSGRQQGRTVAGVLAVIAYLRTGNSDE